ncbi:alpha/beta hydrolase [Singulisphaera rosea]
MRDPVERDPSSRNGSPRAVFGPLVLLGLLAIPLPASAQFLARASIDRINRKLQGQVDDYTHNHGQDRRIFSTILGMPRDLYVYTPPGYSPACAYPVLLYFHIGSVDEHVFIGTNWLPQLDRMIACGEFPPVVVACADGLISGEDRYRSPHSFYINGCGGRFQDHIVQEVLPFVMQKYSIRPEREAHAILGTSAGGFGAMNLALKRRDLFGAVATLAGPLNIRYTTTSGDSHEDFDPSTFRWKDDYNPDEVIGRFYGGLRPVRAKKYIRPVFGEGPGVSARVALDNPADLLSSTDVQPGQLAIYVNYPERDNYNFDAQAQSFAWLAAQKGVEVTQEYAPRGRHNLSYFRNNHERAYRWLAQHLLPPVGLALPR